MTTTEEARLRELIQARREAYRDYMEHVDGCAVCKTGGESWYQRTFAAHFAEHQCAEAHCRDFQFPPHPCAQQRALMARRQELGAVVQSAARALGFHSPTAYERARGAVRRADARRDSAPF
jgi:hypothetical protein